jgi:hypothetical protein
MHSHPLPIGMDFLYGSAGTSNLGQRWSGHVGYGNVEKHQTEAFRFCLERFG